MNGGLSVIGPDGGITRSAIGSSPNGRFAKLTYKTTNADGTVTENIWAENRPHGVPSLPRAINPYIQTQLTSINDAQGNPDKTAIKHFHNDKNGNVTRIDEYDWVDSSKVERNALGFPKPLSEWQWQGFHRAELLFNPTFGLQVPAPFSADVKRTPYNQF